MNRAAWEGYSHYHCTLKSLVFAAPFSGGKFVVFADGEVQRKTKTELADMTPPEGRNVHSPGTKYIATSPGGKHTYAVRRLNVWCGVV